MTFDSNTAPGRRVGLFGGSFDPVHNAHLALAQVALDQLALAEVRWLLTGQPWHKARQVTSAEHRAAMVSLAIAHEPRFVLDTREVRRTGPSYTLDTVHELRAEQPGTAWFLIIGQDQYESFNTWHGWQELLGLVTLAVANRPGERRAASPEVLAVPHANVDLPMIDESSTDIRQRIAAAQGIADLVPAPVARYIDSHHLYQGPLRS